MQTKTILASPTVLTYCPADGENPDLKWQVRCHHSSMGEVGLCYVHKKDARDAAKFIQEFGHLPPPETAELDRRAELEMIAGERPIITACLQCGESAPETGFTCDACREDEMSTPFF